MKKTLLGLAVFAAVGLTSCDEIAKELIKPFDVPVNNIQIDIPVVTNTSAETALGATTSSFNMDSAIKAATSNAFSINAANSIKISQVTLNLTNADAINNMSNFETARIAFNTNNNTAQTTIGSKSILDNNSATNTTTSIDITNSPELKDYLKGSSTMTYTLYAKARRITTHTLNAVVTVTLHVE